MNGQMLDWLLLRSRRERLLLAATAVLLCAVLGWTVVALPLLDRRALAAERWQSASALADWVAQRAGEIPPVSTPASRGGTGGTRGPIGISGIESGLRAAGLRRRVSSLGSQAGGQIGLRFDAVPFTDFAGWLSGAERSWGYDISALRIEPTGEPGMVMADLTLVPPAR